MEVFGRRQQLGLRQQIKKTDKAGTGNDGEGEENDDGKVQGKRGKRLQRKRSRVSKSPAMKRLQKLRSSSSQGPGLEGEAETHSPPSTEGAVDSQCAAKPKAKAKAKAKSKVAKATPKAKGKAKAKSKVAKASPKARGKAKAKSKVAKASPTPKPKAKGKAKAKASTRGDATDAAATTNNSGGKASRASRASSARGRVDEADLDYLHSYYASFENPWDAKQIKKDVREYMLFFSNCAPDIYWSRCESGLSFHFVDENLKKTKKLVGYFSFGDTAAALLVAIGCCLCLVPCPCKYVGLKYNLHRSFLLLGNKISSMQFVR